jgi:hypothetical protein
LYNLSWDESFSRRFEVATGWSEKTRQFADREYVIPARPTRAPIRIRHGEIQKKLRRLGMPAQNANQVGTSLESDKFWKPRGLMLCSPKGQSRSIESVYEFRFIDSDQVVDCEMPTDRAASESASFVSSEDPEARAKRVVDGLCGLLKDEIAAYGGTEAFMRWVRSEEDDAA